MSEEQPPFMPITIKAKPLMSPHPYDDSAKACFPEMFPVSPAPPSKICGKSPTFIIIDDPSQHNAANDELIRLKSRIWYEQVFLKHKSASTIFGHTTCPLDRDLVHEVMEAIKDAD